VETRTGGTQRRSASNQSTTTHAVRVRTSMTWNSPRSARASEPRHMQPGGPADNGRYQLIAANAECGDARVCRSGGRCPSRRGLQPTSRCLRAARVENIHRADLHHAIEKAPASRVPRRLQRRRRSCQRLGLAADHHHQPVGLLECPRGQESSHGGVSLKSRHGPPECTAARAAAVPLKDVGARGPLGQRTRRCYCGSRKQAKGGTVRRRR